MLPSPSLAQQADTPVIDSDGPALSAAILNEIAEPPGLAMSQTVMGLLPGKGTAPAEVPQGPPALTPVVVELFTAQGCSSCPPADALLATLKARPDVLPLSFHVDYWDYLGWSDVFARPDFTERQRDYAARSGERAVWTPQMVVGGTDTLIDLKPAALEQLIAAQRDRRSPLAIGLTRQGGGVTLQVSRIAGDPRPVVLDLIRYLPERATEVRAGENRGRIVDSHNIVMGIERLAQWDGRAPLRLVVKLGAGAPQALPADTRHAILVQENGDGLPGAMLAALPLD